MNFKNIIRILLNAKYSVKKPKIKKVLIFDILTIRKGFAYKFFKKNEFELLDSRFEKINLYVLFFSILKNKFSKLKLNYYKTYINLVSPKIVYTSVDNNLDFFKLKSLDKKPTYISDQFAVSKNAYASSNKLIKKDFYWHCKEYRRITKKKLYADIIFNFGDYENKKMSRFIQGKYFSLGSTKNNFHPIEKIKKYRKKNKILFICSGTYPATIKKEIKIFKFLNNFCQKNDFKLYLLGRKKIEEEEFYRTKYAKGNWKYLPTKKHSEDSYKIINDHQMIVFTHASLGFEALSKNIRCAVFYPFFPERSGHKLFKRKGPFWTNSENYIDFKKLMNKTLNYSNKEWNLYYKKYISKIIQYDPNNRKKKMIINKLK